MTLLHHPLILGSGGPLSADGGSLAVWRLSDSVRSTTDVLIDTFELA